MCGIAGAVLTGTGGPIEVRERVSRMNWAMRHRGPDDEGLIVQGDGRVALANRRLAIRDLSPAGHMPMATSDGSLTITYNGELYNVEELRPELVAAGCIFHSTSDTEVLLQGYAVWGEAVLQRVRGIFAFAILDCRGGPRGSRLVLARDRLGVKPLYYASTDTEFLFASEIRAILAAGSGSWPLDDAALGAYLTLGSVPSPFTIYRDIRALEPGSVLTVPLHEAPSQPRRYWSFPSQSEPISSRDAVDHVRALLNDAVRAQLVSDAPLGAFLSGGIDSSAVVALMRLGTNGTIRTCSISFREADFDESRFAREAAAAAETEHVEQVVTVDDLARSLDAVLAAMDQPTVDGINTYFVSQAAHDAGLTVALSGLGGDELFGGYDATFKGVPQLLHGVRTVQSVPAGAALSGLALSRFRGSRWRKLQDALGRPPTAASAYLARRGLFSPSEVRGLVGRERWDERMSHFQPVDYVDERAGIPHDGDLFGWTSRAELATYTANQLLRDTDVMSMAHSLEVRVPLLDERLVEGVLRLPAAIKKGEPKALLLDALGGSIPPGVRSRSRKQGFTFPFAPWLRGPLRDRVRHMVHDAGRIYGLDARAVEAIWLDFVAGKTHWSRPWALAALLACAPGAAATTDIAQAAGAGT
jgi:asparagine synthase (glutamine-hydrolysing)